MTHHLMVPVDKPQHADVPSKPGVFDFDTGSARLDRLAEDLPRTSRRIPGIPSPFAWPMLFADAVLEPRHEMHGVATREWRGLLALFALRAELGLKVLCVPFGESRLVELVSKLDPDTRVDEQSRWGAGAVFDVVGAGESSRTTFAMTNPWCIVGPAPDPAIALSGIPWWVEGRLCDPCSTDSLSDSMAVGIGEWIGRFFDKDDALAVVRSDMRRADLLAKQLREFRGAMGKKTAGKVSLKEEKSWAGLEGALFAPLKWYVEFAETAGWEMDPE